VHRYNRASAILAAQKVMTAFDAENGKAGLPEGGDKIGPGDTRTPASCRDGHSLNSDELQIMFRRSLDFQTQFYRFLEYAR
jgi:hypothetical protein